MWKFFAPALEKKEAVFIIPIVIFASILFVGGALSGYFLVFPFIIDFALSFAKTGLTPILTMDSYFKIFSKMLLGFGIIFELPLVLVMLAFLRIISSRGLIKFFKFAIIIIFLVAALLTPPDVMSQVLMSAPLILLYLFSILLVIILEKFRGKKDDSE
jgi:sec-independent protein translocase protein TatC